jgi:tetratricopeptide (TPR) repeat protein
VGDQKQEMAQMTRVLTVLAILLPAGARAQPVGDVPERGLAAEAAARWRDALIVYLDALEQEPGRASLWIRVADIQARLGDRDGAIRALTHAAAVSPRDAAIHVRLAEAHAGAGAPMPALDAIDRAVALVPTSVDYLRRRAVLAAWAGAYERARDSYERLIVLDPGQDDARLGLARAHAWQGDTDAAVAEYRRYLSMHAEAGDVWIELARAEAWRGNFAEALRVLDSHRARFGELAAASHERAATLARGGRPREAMQLLDRLLVEAPDDYGLNLSRAVALAAQERRGAALEAVGTVERLRPGVPETRDARALVRVAVASTGEPRASFYSDSDGLRIQHIDPRLRLTFAGGLFVDAGYDRADLRARGDSGLDRMDGGRDARHQAIWAGLGGRLGALTVQGRAGRASHGSGGRFIYQAGARVSWDRAQFSAARESGYLVVSPRTVGLGLTRVAHRVRIDWMPSLTSQVAVDAAYEDLSDGNRRWDLLLAPRRSVARTQRVNLDLGVQLRRFGASRDLDHGYYDPARYESYLVAAFPYWKASENNGVSAALMLGAQRVDRSPSFRLGGTAAVAATFGIYRDWMLELNGSYTLNGRLESGAFRGSRGGAALVRRF